MDIQAIFILVMLGLLFGFVIFGTIVGNRPRTIYQCPKCNDNRVYYLKKHNVVPKCDRCGSPTEKQPGKWVSDALGCMSRVRDD